MKVVLMMKILQAEVLVAIHGVQDNVYISMIGKCMIVY
jgi:hypothetical protein